MTLFPLSSFVPVLGIAVNAMCVIVLNVYFLAETINKKEKINISLELGEVETLLVSLLLNKSEMLVIR